MKAWNEASANSYSYISLVPRLGVLAQEGQLALSMILYLSHVMPLDRSMIANVGGACQKITLV